MLSKKDIFNHVASSCKSRGISPGFNEAVLIASFSLLEARDKANIDYAYHWIKVSDLDGTKSSIKHQIGVLHDVVEDTEWTLEDLKKLGFDQRVIDGVDAMTRREEDGEDYFTFVERCSLNSDALDVKLADLGHNMMQQRNNWISNEYDSMRINKYIISSQYLMAVKAGDIEAGSAVEDFVAKFFKADKNLGIAQDVLAKEGRTFPKTSNDNVAKLG